jgi:hypothetical protein
MNLQLQLASHNTTLPVCTVLLCYAISEAMWPPYKHQKTNKLHSSCIRNCLGSTVCPPYFCSAKAIHGQLMAFKPKESACSTHWISSGVSWVQADDDSTSEAFTEALGKIFSSRSTCLIHSKKLRKRNQGVLILPASMLMV